MTPEQIQRINELAKKAKTEEGLTKEERQEQALLRSQYIEAVRKNLKSQLERIDIQNPDGTIEHLKKRKD